MYLTAGDPNLKTTAELVLALDKAGVDVIELGIPFSDPLADGSIIQAASQRALKRGVTLSKVFELVQTIRRHSQIPLAFMTYYNPIFNYGEEAFVKKCRTVGVDGIITPDLPPEEARTLRRAAVKHGIATVFFISPTTTDARLRANAQASTGFVYYVAITGVTGTKSADIQDVLKHIRRAKRLTSKPVCAGFGISTPQQVKHISKMADGVIVGSAIVQKIHDHTGQANLVDQVVRYVRQLRGK